MIPFRWCYGDATTNKLIINKINFNNNYINNAYWMIPMGQVSFKGDRYITLFI